MLFAVILHVVYLMTDGSLQAASFLNHTQKECEEASAQLSLLVSDPNNGLGIKDAWFKCDEFSVGLNNEDSI